MATITVSQLEVEGNQVNTQGVDLLLSETIRVEPRQISCDLGGEEVILNLNSGVYYGLNPIGSRIWVLINEGQPVKNIIEILLTEYEVDPQKCSEQVMHFLEDLSDRGLINFK